MNRAPELQVQPPLSCRGSGTYYKEINSLYGALDSAKVRSEFRGIRTPRTLADEEFRVSQMGEPLCGAPQYVCIWDGQMSAILDSRGRGPD